MRHALRHVAPMLGLLLLTACDGGGDVPPTAPAQRSEPTTIAASDPKASFAPSPAPDDRAPARPAIRVAEETPAHGQSASRTLSPDQRRLPLTRILAIAQQAVPGEVISVELDRDDDVPEYEVKILTPQGRMIELEIAARTGKILKIEDD